MLRRLTLWLVRALGPMLVYGYFLTLHFRENHRSRRLRIGHGLKMSVFAFWHAQQLSMLVFYRKLAVCILVSRSKDGEYAAILAERFGHRPQRGSTSRGGMHGAKALIQEARRGCRVALTPDGPRGPRHCVQKGVVAIARNVGRPILPGAEGFSDHWELPSWDRFRIPKPFAWCVGLVGEPIAPPEGDDDASLEATRQAVEAAMVELEEEADRQAARWAARERCWRLPF